MESTAAVNEKNKAKKRTCPPESNLSICPCGYVLFFFYCLFSSCTFLR